MIALERFEKALRSAEPGKILRLTLQQLSIEGHSKAEIHQSLEQFLLSLRAREKKCEADEDTVLDVLDALTGWCHPSAERRPTAEMVQQPHVAPASGR